MRALMYRRRGSLCLAMHQNTASRPTPADKREAHGLISLHHEVRVSAASHARFDPRVSGSHGGFTSAKLGAVRTQA